MLTTEPGPDRASCYDRQIAIVDRRHRADWLDPPNLKTILKPFSAGSLFVSVM
jgi:putative SOS response-associated peptidase YedK